MSTVLFRIMLSECVVKGNDGGDGDDHDDSGVGGFDDDEDWLR